MNLKELLGDRFGRLVVTGLAPSYYTPNGTKRAMVHCVCDCGNEKDVFYLNLVNGITKSCGCLLIESRTKEYRISNFGTNKYEICGEYTKVFFKDGDYFLIDTEDLNKIIGIRWYRRDNKNGVKYVVTRDVQKGKQKQTMLHRFIINAPDDLVVDHINHNGYDNRKANLRVCSQQQNIFNSSKRVTSKNKYMGVYKRKDVYVVAITKDNKRIHLGTFDTEEEALIARLKAEKELFGEFAPQRDLFEQYGI